ncbi:MAG: V-type ATPase subunit [Clostridia bacterium]
MPQPSYAYACARISALEKGLLSSATVKRMAEGSLEDAMRQLLDVRYGGMPDASAGDCERMIENVRKETVQTVQELSPEPKLTDLFLLQTDIHNLKVLIKAGMLGTTDFAWQEGGLYSRERLTAAVRDQSFADLPQELANVLDALMRKLKIQPEPQFVSILLDYGYLAHAMKTVEFCKEPFAKQYFTALCDFGNVLTFLRLRAMGAQKEDLRELLLPAGGILIQTLIDAYELSADTLLKVLSGSVAKDAMNAGLTAMMVSGNISMLEKERDNYLLGLVKDHRHDTLTIFPIVGYYLARDREAKAVRLILTVKRNGLDDAVITERLRELYG